MRKLMNRFYPTWLVYDVMAITPQQLQMNDIKGVLLDVDNTIVAWHDTKITTQVKMWIDSLKHHNIAVVLISNNRRGRIEIIAQQLELPFVASAKKPFKQGVLKGVQLLNMPLDNIVIIGDQLFTDILSGAVSDIKTILVKSISHSDMLPTKMIRYVEKVALKYMREKYQLSWRETLEK